MLEFSVFLIRGMCVGLEFPEVDEIHEDLKFSMVIDIAIFRFMFNVWKEIE